MQIRIPQDGKYNQPNKGDKSGNVYRTTNIDFKTNPGTLRLSPRLTINTKDSDLAAGMGLPLSFETYNSAYYAACGIGSGTNTGSGKVLVSSSATPSATFSLANFGSDPSTVHADYSDMVVWANGNYAAGNLGVSLLISTYNGSSSQIQKLYSTTWNTTWYTGSVSGTFKTTSGLKNMCPAFNGNVYIIDDDCIHYIPVSTTTSASNAVLAFNTGTGAGSGTAGTLYFSGRYRPIWIRSSSNRLWIGLMEYDRGVGTRGYVAEWDTTGTAVNRIYDISAPCPLSCVIKDDIPHIIDAYGILKKFNGAGFFEVGRLPVANLNIEMPGIYDDLTNNRWIHHRGMSIVDGKINVSVNNFVSSGVYVKEMPSGVWEFDDKIGFHHKESPCISSADWGQQLIPSKGSGALYGTKKSTGTCLSGFSYYTDNASTQRYAIFYDDIATNTNKRGILETPFIQSPKIEDTFQDLIYRFRPLTSGDHIKPKFRTMKDPHLPFIASATWTSTTTFTSTDANFQYVAADNEVEIVMGPGSSTTSRITLISVSSGTYTITLEEAIGAASGSGKVMVTNYKASIDISDTNISREKTILGDVDTKIQIKTEFRGTGDFEVDDLTLSSRAHQ